MLSLAGMGLGPLRTDAPRLIVFDFSFSGGGVGGNTLRLLPPCSDWILLCRPGLTRLVAAKEMLSAGRSSLTSALPAWSMCYY